MKKIKTEYLKQVVGGDGRLVGERIPSEIQVELAHGGVNPDKLTGYIQYLLSIPAGGR